MESGAPNGILARHTGVSAGYGRSQAAFYPLSGNNLVAFQLMQCRS